MNCACGCGVETPIATKTDSRRGQKKGEPMRFLPGHSSMNGPARGGGSTTEVGVAFLEKLEGMSNGSAAKIVDEWIREQDRREKRLFAQRGAMLVIAEEHELWREIFDSETGGNYTSLERWIVGASDYSRGHCMDAKNTIRELKKDIPMEHLLGIGRGNLKIMVKLSTRVRKSKTVLSRAEGLREGDFIKWLKEEYPDQHVETTSRIHLATTTSEKAAIEEVVDIGRWAFEVQGREEAVEAVMNDWADSPANMEGYEGLTHREAFEKHKKMMDEDEEGAA